jgi:peptide/nickel transport system permease protein
VSAYASHSGRITARRRATTGALRRLFDRPSSIAAGCVLGVIVICSVGASILAPYSPDAFDFNHLFAPPSLAHPFGTDELGRDLLTRTFYAGHTTLTVSLLAAIVAMTLGTTWGFVAAFRRGFAEEVLMRIADLTLGLPVILLALILVAAFGSSTRSLVLILGILFSPATARISRSAILAELESDYYLAAVAAGAAPWRIVVEELLPNTMPILLARSTIVLADAIFVEATLSFVGLGVQPPGASWGTLLQHGYQDLYRSYWYPLFPGIVIVVTVLALNVLGDNLLRALDPARR